HPPCIPLFFLPLPPPPHSTLFPYTTLFRSDLPRGRGHRHDERHVAGGRRRPAPDPDPCSLRPAGPLRSLGEGPRGVGSQPGDRQDRKSTRLNSSHSQISYAVFCLKKKKKRT